MPGRKGFLVLILASLRPGVKTLIGRDMEILFDGARVILKGGEPVIRETGMAVSQILSDAANGMTVEQIVARSPGLTLTDVYAALEYAARVLRQQSAIIGEERLTLITTELISDKILVVDDLETNRRLMTLMFRGTEFQTTEAAGAEEALVKAREERPFLVISDIQMPDVDGYDLCEQLKASPETASIAVIFVTAHHRSVSHVSKGLGLGADDYLYRPFQREELLARVRAVARLKHAEAEALRQARMAERRNRELELLNQLTLAVGSFQELEKILPDSLQKLAQLLDAEGVALFLWDEERLELTVAVSTARGQSVTTSVGRKLADTADLQGQAPTILAQITQEAGLTLTWGAGAGGPAIRSVPLEGRDRALGALSILNKRSGDFTVPEWALLISATGLVTAAVENAWLWQSVQQRVEDLTLLNQVGQALTSTLDPNRILNETTQLVQISLEAEVASLWLLDEAGEHLILRASSGPDAQATLGRRLPLEDGIAGRVVRTGAPYFASDVSQEANSGAGLAEPGGYCPGSILCVPLRIAGRVVGVLQALHRQPNWFGASDLQLFQWVTSSVGIAVENARLFAEVQAFNQQLEQMVAERTHELEQEKDKTWAILANMADALVVLDTEQRIVIANMVAETMLGFQLREVVGRPVLPAWLETPLWRHIDEMSRSREYVSSVSVDVPDPDHPDGLASIQARSSKMLDEQGEIVGTVIVLRDVTALKAVERMKARFMAGVTHELKTPLAVIRMHVNNLITYYRRLPERKRKELFVAIDKQVKLLERLVGNILEISRLDAGRAAMSREHVSVADVIACVVADMLTMAEEKHLVLRWARPAAPLMVMGDESQIERVVRNLIENAVKYTPTGGIVEVEAQFAVLNERPAVGIRVMDTGIGIAPEHREHIFERFYRVDPSHTLPGTGLGLSIVKEIVAAHGGEIQVESTVGKGSTFFVTLPALEP